MKDIEPCPECGGTGEIDAGWSRNSGQWERRTIRCLNCDGTGYLDVPSWREERAYRAGAD